MPRLPERLPSPSTPQFHTVNPPPQTQQSSNGSTKEEADFLKSYRFWGIGLDKTTMSQNGLQGYGECPFCGIEKFYATKSTGECDCKMCGWKGNLISTLRKLYEIWSSEFAPTRLQQFISERKILSPDTVLKWGVVWCPLTSEWCVPSYNSDNVINNLYVYRTYQNQTRWASTPNLYHGLFRPAEFPKRYSTVYVCEGLHDGMSLWEVVESIPAKTKPLVISTPGANVFNSNWSSLLSEKDVAFLYDNDHPYPHPKIPNKMIRGAGISGVERAVNTLSQQQSVPLSMKYLKWGEEGHDESLPSGYDVRDYLSQKDTIKSRIVLWSQLQKKLTPVPDTWVRPDNNVPDREPRLPLIPCDNWKDLLESAKLALKWDDNLTRAFAAMLATIISTECMGDQLWVRVISPPSTGKTVLCEALSVNRTYCFPKSGMTGFYSGFRLNPSDLTEDNSLICQLKNRTLITKDGDTLLQKAELGRILSEARDIYDRAGRPSYRTKGNPEYEGQNTTWILAGTGSLRDLDTSELGERFLTVTVVDEIDVNREREIALSVVRRAFRQTGMHSNGKLENQEVPEMTRFKQLTGGYIQYLRPHAQLLNEEVQKNIPSRYEAEIVDLATLVAYMRCRPSPKLREKIEREMNPRLTTQLARLSVCLATVMNKKTVDDEVMAITRQTAYDTCQGVTLDMVRKIYTHPNGVDHSTLMGWLGDDDDYSKKIIKMMVAIKILDKFRPEIAPGRFQNTTRFRLTHHFRDLYRRVMG